MVVKIAILSTTNASPTLAGIMDSVWIRRMDGSVTVEWDILERIVLSRQDHLLLHLDSHGIQQERIYYYLSRILNSSPAFVMILYKGFCKYNKFSAQHHYKPSFPYRLTYAAHLHVRMPLNV